VARETEKGGGRERPPGQITERKLTEDLQEREKRDSGVCSGRNRGGTRPVGKKVGVLRDTIHSVSAATMRKGREQLELGAFPSHGSEREGEGAQKWYISK